MKKAITVLVSMLSFLLVSCSPPSPSSVAAQLTPAITAQATSTPTLQPTALPTPQPSDTPTLQPIAKPKETPVWNSSPKVHIGMSEDEVIAVLGKPDYINERYDELYLEFKGLSIYFSRSDENSPYIISEFDDFSWTGEEIGKLYLGMPEKTVRKVIGKPEIMGKEDIEGASGNAIQQWTYPSKGIDLYLSWEPDHRKTSSIDYLKITAPFSGKTTQGIGIGSTAEEVLAAYGEGIYPEENVSRDYILVGSTFGGMIFDLTDGKVSEITIGAFAE